MDTKKVKITGGALPFIGKIENAIISEDGKRASILNENGVIRTVMTEGNFEVLPDSYLLAYTLRDTTEHERIMDFWVAFTEYDENDQSPLEQAKNMKGELMASFDDEDSQREMLSCHIAKII